MYSHLYLRAASEEGQMEWGRGGGGRGGSDQRWEGRGRREGGAGPSKGLSSLPLVACCFPLLCQGPLNLLHHSNKAPSITGASPSMRSTEKRRGEAGAHKQDKRPHKRARGYIKPCRLPLRLVPLWQQCFHLSRAVAVFV